MVEPYCMQESNPDGPAKDKKYSKNGHDAVVKRSSYDDPTLCIRLIPTVNSELRTTISFITPHALLVFPA
jgi:hypothetical protein